MKAFKVEAIVIKRKNFGEADRIITVFSKNKGKLQVKAQGVRRIASRRSPHIELLNYANFSLHQGRNIAILTEVESIETFPVLKKDLKRIGSAFHVCELIDGLCAENQESAEIFDLLSDTLKKIATEEKLAPVILEFEKKLLMLLGFYKEDNGSKISTKEIIENILERRLKTRPLLYQFSS